MSILVPTARDLQPRVWMQQALASPSPSLDRIALAIAAVGNPDVDANAVLGRLDELGARVKTAGGDSVREKLEALRQVLAVEERFRGDPDDYFAPENSFLDRVFERRKGLPIALSILYVEVGRRAGIPLFGIPFPAHFVAGAELEDGSRVAIDAFEGGRVLGEQDCEALLQRVAPGTRFEPGMLAPASPQAIAFRMLNNLKRVYLEREDYEHAVCVVDLMLAVEPEHPGELRTRARLFEKLGAFRAALVDVERALREWPQPPDHAQLLRWAKTLRDRVTLLN